ncbi:Cu/Ag efflux pump CusA [Zhongshania antarctica]|uniref:Cu/Ag efflux pump CusA n=1 Tax=Zhongshania antarctica TaxID=641702 RepID=A0A840R8U2_9GAMM|nr:efflux RND transporter permease subunit [Zhongshania antarctica]MBB5188863.1 Cu/Ag efflux pump CusA [Zhongshania antarctica]
MFALGWTEAVVDGVAKRLRPKLMTGLALLMGLVPIMLSNGSSADLMKWVAAPMVGGVATSLIMVLVVFPALFVIWKQTSKRGGATIESQ